MATLSKTVRPRKSYRWHFRDENLTRSREIEKSLRLNPAIARMLANRGLSGLEQFFRPALAGLHDPFLLRDMDLAVDRIIVAQEAGEVITVFGDYDVDGVTSTSVLLRTFRFLKIACDYYIPHRLNEGYGMNTPAVENIAANGTRLIVTVDCGISGLAPIARARELGVDVIVTDHHQPGLELPQACAVINPNRLDCTYPDKGLAGVGVAFKLAHALLKRMRVPQDRATPFLRSLLDLVAIGTIADYAPVIGENRIMVRHGLDQISSTSNVGIQELMMVADAEGGPVTTQKIGFQVAPRINAAGRTDSARICVELFTTADSVRAADIARQLDQFNRDRRLVETGIFEQCLRFVEQSIDLDSEMVMVVNGTDWHLGVIGIVASKIMEIYDRPVIILSEQNGHARGSARSTKGFNIHKALHECREHLSEFGGHPSAAGLQLKTVNIASFRRSICDYARGFLSGDDLMPSLMIDTQVTGDELNESLMRDLSMLEPYGSHNPAPVFAAYGLNLAEAPRIVGTNHLKLQFSRNGRAFSAIGFNMAGMAGELTANRAAGVDVVFVPTINTYYPQHPRVEMELKDIKIASAARG